MAGGVSLNCVANGRILAETPFKRIFIQPAANDAGTAIGAALYYYYSREIEAPRHPIDHAYLGNAYRDEDIEATLNRRGLRYTLPRNLTEQLAGFMKEGKIIGWFSGRMEIGPRALGNRSILTAPFPAEMKDILNSKVKHREPFRPFAPIVRLDECGDYFEFDHESPYMLLAYRVRDERAQDVPAITHVDGTARVQTVTRDQNNEIYELISEFKRQTGVGVILNTSFNVMGQPIVETPEIAIDCFMGTQMDYLVFNNRYLVEKQ
jgi:carbamoyltransferase